MLVILAAGSSTNILSQNLQSGECGQKIVAYADRPSLQNPEYRLDLTRPAGGQLLYFGAAHSSDPAHPQFAAIQTDWARFRPTVVFYEGPARAEGATVEETIREYGESGLVRFLAKRHGARIERLEPTPGSEAAYVAQRFPAHPVKLLYILREVSRLRERRGLTEFQLRGAVEQMLQQITPIVPEFAGVIATTAELDKAYRQYWKEPINWWEAPVRWFDPGVTSAETGGIFTNEINRTSSEFRDRHMYEALLREVEKGERVLAVVGRDHVAAQAPALRCAVR